MSRSYKKPYLKGAKHSAFKRAANKVLRHISDEIPNGKAFRKFFQSYKICEYTFYQPETLTAYRK